MPSRDPSQEDPSPEPRWGAEMPREAGRDVERRYRPSAFGERDPGGQDEARAAPGSAFAASRQMRAAGPAGPGSNYGGSGRASGSQSYGEDPGLKDRPTDVPGEGVPVPQADRRRAGQAWEGTAPERSGMPTGPGRSGRGPEASASRHPSVHGAERSDDTQFDADYRQWREEQMRLLDLDYAQWRKERYRKFAEEFSQWRSQRLKASPARSSAEDAPASLGEISPLGPSGPALRGEDRDRPFEQERERAGGGLLSSLLGGHSERHKPQP